MSAPTIVECLRSLGYAVPADAAMVELDSQEDPTWIEFSAMVDGKFRRIGGRSPLSPDLKALVVRAVQLHYVGYRLSRRLPG